ncbi:short-chain dehydrogenase [Dyella jejuensis]
MQSLQERLASSTQVAALAVDYRAGHAFSQALQARIDEAGVPDLVLAWIHDASIALRLAAQLAAYGQPLDFFHVLGSASASPNASLAQQRMAYDAMPALSYHQLVLGFVCEGPDSRWLDHDEIVQGVRHAIQAGDACQVIGVVEPWARRP